MREHMQTTGIKRDCARVVASDISYILAKNSFVVGAEQFAKIGMHTIRGKKRCTGIAAKSRR